MKKLLLLATITAFVVCPYVMVAQKSSSHSSPTQQNLKSIQNDFYAAWSKRDHDAAREDEEEGEEGYNQFKRWEWQMQSRTFPSGNLPDPGITARERDSYLRKFPNANTTRNAAWEHIGTSVVPSNGGGAGRINVIRFDPVTPSTFYIGGAGGGIWKTSDNGSSWTPLGDQLPVTSIADIAIDPLNTNIIYAATGDGYGYEATWQSDSDFWGGVYAAGIFKSIHGGSSWEPTGLSFQQDNLEIIQRMLIHPTNPDILLAATRNGIYRTTDAGDTWTLVQNTHCYDMAFNTANPDYIYAAGNKDILLSTDAGATWSVLADNLGGSGRISIETTPANSNVIYALFEKNSKLFKSSDGGLNWETEDSPPAGFYGYYDMVMALSPFDENLLITGGYSIARSQNGGQNWQIISDATFTASDYVHPDNHALEFDPLDAGKMYSGNDGGIFRSSNLGSTWSDLSNGLSIAQIYRLSSSVMNPSLITSGWQDNGCNLWNGSNWKQIFYADGMETIIDYTNPDIIYMEYQGGALEKSTDGGNNWSYISPSYGTWLTPYVMDPENHLVLYYGGSSVYKTTNGGNSWSDIGDLFSGDYCYALAVAPSNTNYVYAASLDKIFVTTTGSGPWTNITAGLPNTEAGINYIAVSNTDPLSVWVVFSGYSDGNKVFHSADGGNSWDNVSGSLPNVPANTIVYHNDSPDGVYIGTDIGVFYKDNTLSDWMFYNTGLPNVMVHELEINYNSNKLLAATYGRGLWQSDLYYTVQYANDIGAVSVDQPVNDVCYSIIDAVINVKNYGSNPINSFDVDYSVDSGPPDTYTWNGSLASLATVSISLPSITGISAGNHIFHVSTSNPNGNTDNNLFNDDASSAFTVVGGGASLPVQEGFETGAFPPTGWSLNNDDDLWSMTNTAGGFGNSSHSAKADFFHVSSGSDYLTTEYLNFSDAIPPVKLKFSVAYARRNANKNDTLKVAVSTDCGQTFSDEFIDGGLSLATAPDLQSAEFIPAANQWKDEVVDLSPYDSFDKVLIRFEVKSDHGNDLYLDDINLYGLSTNVATATSHKEIFVFPNPSERDLNVVLSDGSTGEIIFELYDLTGKRVFELKKEKYVFTETYQLNTLVKTPGFYLLKVKTNYQTHIQQVELE